MNSIAIGVHNLTYAYPDGTSALRSLTFEVKTGEKVALVGRNGAGKSTLLLALGGFLDVKSTQGSIEIGGMTLEKSAVDAIRRKLGIVFQNPDHQLFMPTVEDDIAFGPLNMGLEHDEIDRRVDGSLRQTGTEHLRGKPPHHLSVGEKHRVAIATVLSMEPEILLMDEPSSNLDPAGRRSLIELLRSMPHTILIAGHDLELMLELCQQTCIIDDGRVVACGPTIDLLADEPLMLKHGLEVPASLRNGKVQRTS
jgi:cobalt/nickel transport system ATP-binding protein